MGKVINELLLLSCMAAFVTGVVIAAQVSSASTMRLEDRFGGSLQRNERVKLAAAFWNNIGAGMVIGGVAAAFFLEKPAGAWAKIGIALAGLVLGWVCYSIASNLLTYMRVAAEDRH
jgi:MFS family permease